MNLINKNKTRFAFTVSVAAHLILISCFFLFVNKKEVPHKLETKNLQISFAQTNKQKISTQLTQELENVKPKMQESNKIKQKKIEPNKDQIASQMTKKIEVNETKIEPKIIKKQTVEHPEETKIAKTQQEKIIEKPQAVEQKQPQIIVQNIPKTTAVQQQSLESFLGSKIEPAIDEKTQSYIKLYGKEFESFDSATKKYLIDNLSGIGNVTKKYLTYPQISIKTNQQGLNAVEFILMPNGDINDLKLLQSSFYSALDQSTLRTIQIAYKDYPKPSKPTKIRIYINYILR